MNFMLKGNMYVMKVECEDKVDNVEASPGGGGEDECVAPDQGVEVFDLFASGGGSNAEERALIATHLKGCRFCREEIEGWEQLIEAASHQNGRLVHSSGTRAMRAAAGGGKTKPARR